MKKIAPLLVACALVFPSYVFATESVWVEPATGARFLPIAKGCYFLGSDVAGRKQHLARQLPPRDDERPRHQVCLDAFLLAETETTESVWQRIQGVPSTSSSSLPQTGISWEQVQSALARFNQREAAGVRLRLPTEAEWEYACRVGAANPDYKHDDDAAVAALGATAWTLDTTVRDRAPHEVAQKKPNAWGLFDMLGNVWEMTEDGYRGDAYQKHLLYNPKVTRDSEKVVIRGGSFRSHREQARCAERNYAVINDALPTVGFRLIAEPVKAPVSKVEK